jgi:hypothetical protein
MELLGHQILAQAAVAAALKVVREKAATDQMAS